VRVKGASPVTLGDSEETLHWVVTIDFALGSWHIDDDGRGVCLSALAIVFFSSGF
jgi:hypothetical protein